VPNDEETTPALAANVWIPDALGNLAGSLRAAAVAIEGAAAVVRARAANDQELGDLVDELAELAELVHGARRGVQRFRRR
jgi:hypothetical protein